MTDSNSAKMSMAEKLAQKLKESPFGELIDEDGLTALTAEAIQKAFFEPIITKDRYGSVVGKAEPAIVTMAREVFKVEVQRIAKDAADKLAADPVFIQAIADVAIGCVPDMLINAGRNAAGVGAANGANMAMDMVKANLKAQLNMELHLPIGPPAAL